jgi:hypothetical protein
MKYLLILITLFSIGCITEPEEDILEDYVTGECKPDNCKMVRTFKEYCFIPKVSNRDIMEVQCGFEHYESCYWAGEREGVCEEQYEYVEVCE